MDQFRQIGKVLGSMKALMVFKEEIQINQKQCCLLVEIFGVAFERVAEAIKENLKFEERHTKWTRLEYPLKELHRLFKEADLYVHQCLEIKDWWAKVILLSKNTDCVEYHIHNLLCCMPIVMEVIEMAGETAGCDDDDVQRKRFIYSRKYDREWKHPKLFQSKFGKQYLVSEEICNRLNRVWREDWWSLLQSISEKRNSGSLTKNEQRLVEILSNNMNELASSSNCRLFPSSILIGSKDYQVRRRLGNGSQYKEIQWLGESFAVRHFFGEIEPLLPDISLVSSLAHPNVAHFLCGFCDEEKKECFLVMELMKQDLNNYIKESCGPRKQRPPCSLTVAVDIMLQIARGMEYLHSRKFYHGDLNPSNILVRTRNSSSEGYLHVKISGFNMPSAKNFNRSLSNSNGTQNFIWHAPEVLLEQEQPGSVCSKHTEKADVYSFGMICFELLTGKVPFDDSHLQGDKMSRNIRAGERPLFPFQSPKYLVNLTKKCWQTEPAQRPSFASICRVLRYIKKFFVMNPDHSQPDGPSPSIDYWDLEMAHSKMFSTWENEDLTQVSQIPFHMFAYKILEKEKINVNLREKSSESGSDGGASVCEDENAGVVEDPFPTAVEKKPLVPEHTIKRTMSAKKASDMKTNKPVTPRGRLVRPPPQLSCGGSLRMKSESQLVIDSPNRRRRSGHASDSELP